MKGEQRRYTDMATRFRYDLFLPLFWLMGSVVIIITLLALMSIAIPELADLPHLASVAAESGVIEAILLTMVAALVAVIFLVIFCTPLAYVLVRSTTRWKEIVENLVDIPLVLPHTVAGLMVYLLFMSRGPLGTPLKSVGIIFEDAFFGIVVAMIFVSSPYYINAVREGFEKVPVHLENVARTLGASRFYAFWHITLPLSTRHLLSGSFLAWGRSVGEFAAVVMIAYFPMVVSTLIYQRFTTGGLAESRSVAFIMIIICITVFVIFRWVTRKAGRPYHDRT
jgi:molybdate/tungstate transport system permease protein